MTRQRCIGAVLAAWLGLLMVPLVAAQGLGERFVDPEGGFSFRPPAGWVVEKTFESPFLIAHGPMSRAFTPYILVEELVTTDALSTATETYVRKELSLDREVEYLLKGPFRTDLGLTGMKVAVLCHMKGHSALRIFYVFEAPETNRKLVVSCNTKADDVRHWHAVFDRCMKSFGLVPRGWTHPDRSD